MDGCDMKLYDFDKAFYNYCAAWLKQHPDVAEDQVDEQYNALMEAWLDQPDAALGGIAPKDSFADISDPGALTELMSAYDREGMAIPEPLCARLVALDAGAVPALKARILDASGSEAVRSTSLQILREIDPGCAKELALDLVLDGSAPDELTDEAAALLDGCDGKTVDALLCAYEGAPDERARLILDICSNSFDPRVTDLCLARMAAHPEERVFCASLLGRMGDERALGPLMRILRLSDVGYVEYREIANAIEMLGGDPGPQRDFTGDADLEALQAAESDWGLE